MALNVLNTITLSGAIEMYFVAKRAQRLSEHTLSDYKNTFNKFSRFVGENCEINKINPSIIASFLAKSDGLSKKTTLNYHTGLSSLWNYMVENSLTERNIVRVVKPPRPDEKQILPLLRQDIIALLEMVKDSQFPVRNRVIILLLLDCGLRASELCSLRVKDVDLIHQRVLIKGKGGKERSIPFSHTTLEALQAHFKARRLSSVRDRYSVLFISANGNIITRKILLQLLVKIGIRAGVPSCHTHRFRHTFAIQFLRNGGNIYTLQMLLGHTQLDMVKRYLAIAQTDLDRDHEKASPVKGWGL